jgi:hypothetical protein
MGYPAIPVLDAQVSNQVQRVSNEYSGGLAITPSDSADLSQPVRCLQGTTATGYIKVTLIDGTTVTFYAYQTLMYPMLVKRVWSTGTTATGIIGLY